MLKRIIVVVVAMVAMVALIAGGVVSAVDITGPSSDPNENPDANVEAYPEIDPDENIGVAPEPETEADPEQDPELDIDEDEDVAPEPGRNDDEELDPGEGADDDGEVDPDPEPDPGDDGEPDDNEDFDDVDEDEDENGEDDEDIVNNVFALNIIEAYPDLNLTEADIRALREAGFGWGEVSIACGIAVNSGDPLANIIALAGEGQGWGEIAKSLGVEDRAFGQYVRGVIGKGHAYGKDKEKQSELDDAASMDMVLDGYGLSEQDVTELIELGYGARDVLCAVSLVASSGEASKLELVLQLRSEKRNWAQVAKELGVKDNDMPDRIRSRTHVELRQELKEALKNAVKEQVKEQNNKGNKDNKGNEGNKGNKSNKDKAAPSNAGKPAHAGIPGQGAKRSETDKSKGSSGK
jgi:flagellar basal body-associated protein FliL